MPPRKASSFCCVLNDLPDSHKSVNEFRVFVRQPETQYTSPRMAQNKDLFPFSCPSVAHVLLLYLDKPILLD